MSKHAAIYLRVSSRQQDTRSQEADLERWEAAQDGPVQRYVDKASGTTMDRPGWNKLEDAMRGGKISSVVVWRLDRLGRTASGLTTLFDLLRAHKVNLVSIKDGLDLSTPAGRLMANVLASVAQFETEVRGERVAAGQAAAKARGVTWGGSKKGIRKKVTKKKARAIKKLKAEGETVVQLAKDFGLSRGTIYAVLNDPD